MGAFIRGRWAGRSRLLMVAAALAILIAAGWALLSPGRAPRSSAAREAHFFPMGEAAYLAGDYDLALSLFQQSLRAEPRDARPYYRLVDCCTMKGDVAAAERILDSLLVADPGNARAHYGLGCAALKRQDPDRALSEALRAAELDPDFGYARLLMGSAHNISGRPDEAFKAWRTARALFRAEGNIEGESWAVNRMALVHRQRGEHRKAIDGFEEALRLQRLLGDRNAQIIVLGNLGLAQADLGDIAMAHASFREAIALARAAGDGESECWLLSNLSFLESLAGDHLRAVSYADSAVAIAHLITDRLTEVQGLVNRATACTGLGDPVRAIETCRQALAIADSLADPRDRANVLLAMGEAYLDLGRTARARAAFAESDTLYRKIGHTQGSWSALVGLCEVAIRDGDSTAAAREAERTMDLFVHAGYAEGAEYVALTLSDLAAGRRDPERALFWVNQAVASSRRDGRRLREALALARRASIHLLLGQGARADADAERSLGLAHATRNPQALWFSEMAAGDVRRERDPDGALVHYRASIEAVEWAQRSLRLDEFKAGCFERRIEPYFKTAALLVSMGRAKEAFEVCEKSRARALREFLGASPAQPKPDVPEALARATRELEGRLRILHATLAGVAASKDPDHARIRAIERDIVSAKTEWDDAAARIRLEDPRFAGAGSGVSAPTARRVLDSIPPGDALVEYFLGPDSSLCIVATAGTMHGVPLSCGAGDLARAVHAFRAPLTEPASLATLGFDAAAAEEIRRMVFDPLRPYLDGATRVLVVPDGALHECPFEALIVSDRDEASSDTMYASFGNAEFLGDRFSFRYLPSADLLVQVGSRRTPRAAADLVAFGGPAASGPAGAPHDSDSEARAIAALFPGSVALVGGDATERAFKDISPQFRTVHVATHGTADGDAPLYSSLHLARDEENREDGSLHAFEVLDIPLRCDLVTLSACETGLGRLYAGEGVLGLPRAFLYAGARQVVAALWKVDDASSAIFMEKFYANLARGLEEAEALAQAKRSLKQTVAPRTGGATLSYAHPFFWAPFVIIGLPVPPDPAEVPRASAR